MTADAHNGHDHTALAMPAGAYTVMPAYLVPADEGRVTSLMIRLFHRSPRWTTPLLVAICFAGGVAYTLLTRPTEAGAFSSPTCIVKMTTGFDCPGCGGTRAFWYLLHGDVAAAARSHLLAVFAAPFLLYMFIAWSVNHVAGSAKIPYLRLSPRAISIYLAVWGAFTILRNLPWAPFTWFYV